MDLILQNNQLRLVLSNQLINLGLMQIGQTVLEIADLILAYLLGLDHFGAQEVVISLEVVDVVFKADPLLVVL